MMVFKNNNIHLFNPKNYPIVMISIVYPDFFSKKIATKCIINTSPDGLSVMNNAFATEHSLKILFPYFSNLTS
jgi:hypothetical protein